MTGGSGRGPGLSLIHIYFGGSSAQSVVLMLIVMVLTFLQFRYVERKVTY